MTDANAETTQDEPLGASYVAALERYEPAVLRDLLRLAGEEPGRKSTGLASRLRELLDRAELPGGESAVVAGLAAICQRGVWWARDLVGTLEAIGRDPNEGLAPLLAGGWVAVKTPEAAPVAAIPGLSDLASPDVEVIVHPTMLEASPRLSGRGGSEPEAVEAGQIRQADGLEAVLRLAALWQRVGADPLRRTQAASLFKRDHERLAADEALSGPVADSVLPGHPAPGPEFWLELAVAVGLVVPDARRDGLVAADAEVWSDLGVHLPQMLASRWLTMSAEPSPVPARLAALVELSSLPEGAWITLGHLAERLPAAPAAGEPEAPKRGAKKAAGKKGPPPGVEGMICGPAYLLGLVRLAESIPARERLAQVTDLGRYVLGQGPPPSPPERPDRYLFIQPNFDVIAYRQGLGVPAVARLARMAEIQQIGSAVTLRLTKESVHRALQYGQTADQVREWLDDHTVRPMPDGVARSIRSWSEHRDRLAYYSSATLIEFPSGEALESSLADWPSREGVAMPLRVAERILLVESESAIPFEHFRMGGSRDYRRPPEACVTATADGLGLSIDPSRGDLFVEAEIERFAEGAGESSLARQFQVTGESLTKAADAGMNLVSLARWYERRTGAPLPASVRLVWQGRVEPGPPGALRASRRWIVRAATPEVMEGLLQHPDTRSAFDERMGPTSATVRDTHIETLRAALRELGLPMGEAEEG